MKRRILFLVIGIHALTLSVAMLVKPDISHQILTPIRVSTYTYEPPPPPKQQVITKASSVVKKAQPPKKKPAPPKARDVLTKVQKNLQKIDSRPQKTKPKTISYATLMMQRLQSALSLPEEGDVKLQLTLNADGKVLKLSILHSQSERNSQYLSQILPSLIFPGFTGDLQGHKQHTFTLTVCHDS